MSSQKNMQAARRFDITRRFFLGKCTGIGLGAMALADLLKSGAKLNASTTDQELHPAIGQLAPRAKRVIFLTQSGGPSQIELFDHKPGLQKWAGKELPESVRQGQRLTTMTSNQKQSVMPSRTYFERCGQSGATIG